MAEFRVRWEVDVWVDTPREAAQLAHDMQQDPSEANYFTVELPDGDWMDVDLNRDPRPQELTVYQGEDR